MQVGDKVIYTSGTHGRSRRNPLHSDYPQVIGIIVNINDAIYDDLPIRVEWSNDKHNSYCEADLEVINTKTYYKQKRKLKI